MDGWMDRENNDSNLRAGAQDFIFLPNFFGGGIVVSVWSPSLGDNQQSNMSASSQCLPGRFCDRWSHTYMKRMASQSQLSIVSTIMADLLPDIEMQVLLCTVGGTRRGTYRIGPFRVTLQGPFVYMIRPHLFFPSLPLSLFPIWFR